MPIAAGLMMSNILTSEPTAARTRSASSAWVSGCSQAQPTPIAHTAEVQKPIATTVRHE